DAGDGSIGDAFIAPATCDPLPPIPPNVSDVAGLAAAVAALHAGDTIALADGTYDLSTDAMGISIKVDNVTVRSASGHADAVILDERFSKAVFYVEASNATIAGLTIVHSKTPAVTIQGAISADSLGVQLYDVTLQDNDG